MQRAVIAILLVLAAGTATAATASPSLVGAKHYMPVFGGHPLGVDVTGSPLLNHGGPVQHSPHVYLVFWGFLELDPTHQMDPSGEAQFLIDFMGAVGGSPWAAVQTQYDDSKGHITNPTGQLAGVWFDDGGYPPFIQPDNYMTLEVQNAAKHFGYPADDGVQYVIATPHNFNTQGFRTSYCAWHSRTYDGNGHTVSFTNLPYITDAGGACGQNFVNHDARGRLDGVSIVEGHEYTESATDPQLNAWYDAGGAENGDKCAWTELQNIQLSTGRFAVQPSWSNVPDPVTGDECRVAYP